MDPLVTALSMVTISCAKRDSLVHLLSAGAGWHVAGSGAVTPALERLWGIDSGSAGDRWTLLGSPGADRGMIRVVAGAERPRTRPIAARWAGAEILVMRDIDALFERLSRSDAFTVLVPPFDTDWSDVGSNVHRAFIGRAPGGTHLAFTMAVTQPKGRDFPSAHSKVGHVFDVPLVTVAFERSRDFYQGSLGMVPILTSRLQDHQWHEIWRLPPSSVVRLDIIKGDAEGTGLGGIEMQGYDAELVDGEPALDHAFDGGACLVTYTSRDISAAYAAVVANPYARILSEPRSIESEPYAGRRAFAFMGPSGERVELCDLPMNLGQRSEAV